MRTIETTVYTFDELDERAKERAREWYRNAWHDGGMDHDWWDCVFEDAKAVGALLGIRIDRIYFSGFWSQGDGACFEGTYQYRTGSAKAVREYCPEDSTIHDIADRLQAMQKREFYSVAALVRQSGHYVHHLCTRIEVEDIRNGYESQAESECRDLLREFMQWIYRNLEAEYEYLTSDDSMDEGIRCNDYEFTKDGAIA